MDDNYRTPLVEAAITMATRNHHIAKDAIFHTDRGSNYTSSDFANVLKKLNLRHSVGRTGVCYDNAMAESFFAALKNERVHRTQYPHPRTRPPRRCPIHRTPIQFPQTSLGDRVSDPQPGPCRVPEPAARSVNLSVM